MTPVGDLQPAFDERHGLTELVLGLWSVVRPLARFATARRAPAARLAPAADDDALLFLLGAISFAWHLEVFFRDRAPAPAPAAAPALSELLR
jgi:hypothetical protein